MNTKRKSRYALFAKQLIFYSKNHHKAGVVVANFKTPSSYLKNNKLAPIRAKHDSVDVSKSKIYSSFEYNNGNKFSDRSQISEEQKNQIRDHYNKYLAVMNSKRNYQGQSRTIDDQLQDSHSRNASEVRIGSADSVDTGGTIGIDAADFTHEEYRVPFSRHNARNK